MTARWAHPHAPLLEVNDSPNSGLLRYARGKPKVTYTIQSRLCAIGSVDPASHAAQAIRIRGRMLEGRTSSRRVLSIV
jgi:hypothetical protein